jgi:Zn-dependent protease with chaperone function
MAIPQEKFETLVNKLEKFAKTHPRSYRIRVALFAFLGYGYIFMVLAGLIAMMGLIVALIVFSHRINGGIIRLAIFLLVPTWIILQSLWVKFSLPEGLKLSRHEVPQLFTLVDELTTKLQAPRFHNILLNRDFNAGVLQLPRLGIFGWQENYLLLGLPLMQSLTIEQLTAVLGHEIGHLSGNHSRFAAWIYRIRKTWMQIYERLQQSQQPGASILFNLFFNWYWPAFNAYSFTLARMNEYEADRCAAELAGVDNTAEALMNVEIKRRFLENSFWLNIDNQVKFQADAPNNTYSSMLRVLHEPITAEDSQKWLLQALAEQTNCDDTHPCLGDRIKSLLSPKESFKLRDLRPPEVTAAEHLLGNTLQQFAHQFDQEWQVIMATPWRQQYTFLQERKNKLENLEQKAQKEALNHQELWEKACYTYELEGDDAALPCLREVLEGQPNHIAANYMMGRALLQQANPSGIDYIENAIAQKPDWVMDGCGLIYNFLSQQGQTEEAQSYRERAEHHHQIYLKAEEERLTVSGGDRFKPHSIEAAQVDGLKRQLVAYPEIQEAYLVEKVLTYFPEKPFCVLGIIRKRNWLEGQDKDQQLIKLLAKNLQFPIEAYILILNHPHAGKLKQKICGIKQSLIFKA